MRNQAISALVILLSLASYACSSEPSSPPSTKEQFHTEETVQTTAADSLASNLTDNNSQTRATNDCTAIMETHCTACHHVTRICQKLGKKNLKGWRKTINNMKIHGAQLTPSETEALAICLDRQSQDIKEFCR